MSNGAIRMRFLFVQAAMVAACCSLSPPANAQLSAEEIANAPDQNVAPSAAFQFGRTHFFSALLSKDDCGRVFPDRTAAAQKRFREVVARLATHFGSRFFDADSPVDLSHSPPQECDEAMLGSFEQKIGELASWADRADLLKPKA